MSFEKEYYLYIEEFDYQVYPDEKTIIPILKNLDKINAKPIFNYTVFFTRIIDKYNLGSRNRCSTCNIDMGIHNPRQLCGKFKCDFY